MLHGIDESGSVLSLRPAELESLLTAIRRSGHALVPLAELLDDSATKPAFALSFDDGFASLSAAAPLLRDAGARPTLFLTTGYVGRTNRWPSQPASAPCFEMLRWDQVERLHGEGWDIEAHSATHPDLRGTSDGELAEELGAPREELARRLGRAPRFLAYPYGFHDERVVRATAALYEAGFGTSMRSLDHGIRDRHRIPRLDTYYLRSPAVHARVGRIEFRAWVQARAWLRRLRRHPGEID
jgi:peptidoglycan/xylan/chitin deacetylase (PgdA/CDA1 family)